jgi:2-hydroxychromene-2-carboxylate isomerase
VAAIGGWCPECTKATFQARFLEKKEIGMPDHVEAMLRALGKSAGDVVAQSQAPGTDRRLKTVTAAARQLGIFGSPSFAVGHETFWGDDRREEAIACAAGVKWPAATPKPAPRWPGQGYATT